MAVFKPFRGLRPPRALAEDLACLPYDVMNTDEARKMAKGKECSLLHITRSEIDLHRILILIQTLYITSQLRISGSGRKRAGWFRMKRLTFIFMHKR
jgi:uncharacterized protein (DUF1015 family)